jgi:CheY-like chemotaxis protein
VSADPKKMSHILVVEDSQQMLGLLKDFLEHEGYSVKGYRSASEALGALKAGTCLPAVAVISDFAMPGMNGLEFLREIKAQLPQLPVVLITAYGSPDLAAASRAIPQSAYLTKPFPLSDLGTALQRLIH